MLRPGTWLSIHTGGCFSKAGSQWRSFAVGHGWYSEACTFPLTLGCGRIVGPGVRDFQIHTVQHLPLLHGSKGGTRWGKKCYGQEGGPKTWSQSSFQTLLFLNQQNRNVSLLTVSSWQLLMPISCYLEVFFLIFVFESLKCFPFSIMSEFPSGFHRMVAIFKPEGHKKRVPECTHKASCWWIQADLLPIARFRGSKLC